EPAAVRAGRLSEPGRTHARPGPGVMRVAPARDLLPEDLTHGAGRHLCLGQLLRPGRRALVRRGGVADRPLGEDHRQRRAARRPGHLGRGRRPDQGGAGFHRLRPQGRGGHALVWGLAQTVAPADEPVTRDEAMLFCRADNPEEAPLFDGLIRAARRRVERGSSRQLVTATWQLTLDSFFDLEPRSRWTLQAVPGQEDLIPQLRGIGIFSAGNVIRLPKSPLRSVVSVQYVDTGGNPQTLDPSRYLTDLVGQPGRIAPAYGTFWPITRRQINAVTV